jgi:flavin-dependent dehydrogenase
LAVSDTACAYDPITSHGIYNALHDGTRSATAIADHSAGVVDAFGEYQASIVARFTDYLANRNYLCDLEQRWPSSLFSFLAKPQIPARHHFFAFTSLA